MTSIFRERWVCKACGRDWTDELAARLARSPGDFVDLQCTCGQRLHLEGTGTGVTVEGLRAEER